VIESAVGTIRPITEAKVGSKILAHVRTMHVTRAGQSFRRGDVLVDLEDADLRARLAEAEAALKSAEATLVKAKSDLERSRQLFAGDLASKQSLERDQAAAATAQAEVERQEQTVVGARTALGYATITAPIDGIVIDKYVNQGDLVAPGRVLVTMYDPTRLQLVAVVREKVATQLRIGQETEVRLDVLGKVCPGRVDQIVPEASPGSRSFEVKVTGPCSPEVMSGMFARMSIPVGRRTVLRVPKSAVRSIGQLDVVYVVLADGRLLRRFVRLGDPSGETVEVLSGLASGETVVADAGEVR
jgi:RND family efflux transporter MFP subunit